MATYSVDNSISLTMFECSRPEPVGAFEKKFVADCGNKIVISLTKSLKIVYALPENPDSHSCQKCREKIKFVKNLIASGTWKP